MVIFPLHFFPPTPAASLFSPRTVENVRKLTFDSRRKLLTNVVVEFQPCLKEKKTEIKPNRMAGGYDLDSVSAALFLFHLSA